MTQAQAHVVVDRAELAEVIELPTWRNSHDDEPRPEPRLPDRSPALALEHAVGILRGRAGDGWEELPADLGRPAARIEALLSADPPGTASTVELATDALARAELAAAAAGRTLDLLHEPLELLGEALEADLSGFVVTRVRALSDCLSTLSRCAEAVPAWGDPARAAAADVLLQAIEPDLAEAARSHALLYATFHEGVWDVPVHLLRRGRRWWRPAARARLRARLRHASRAGTLPWRLRGLADCVLEAHAARRRHDQLRPLVDRHLGDLHRGPLGVVDVTAQALAAVRRLQVALGPAAVPARIQHLISAGAFQAEELQAPARATQLAIQAWHNDLRAAGGAARWSLETLDLQRWTEEVGPTLLGLREALVSLQGTSPDAVCLADLVDVLLLREHVGLAPSQLAGGTQPHDRSRGVS